MMKSRFVTHKDRFKKISLAYRKTGEWIKPTNDETGTKCLWPFGPSRCMKLTRRSPDERLCPLSPAAAGLSQFCQFKDIIDFNEVLLF